MRERKNGVIEWTMRHYQITLLVITVLVGLGIWGLVDMPKQEFPEFTIRPVSYTHLTLPTKA